jgi:hypothetical protein
VADPGEGADPFGCADRRRRVLDAWRASPSRFREDANAEEDHARGGYRDRLLVELAQNAADAAARAGRPGRLSLRLVVDDDAPAGWTLVAANTGAPLDADGVEALATLRASAKRDDDPRRTVGRFGVGFAAVLAVTDDPAVRSTTGGVRWSADRTRAAVAAVPELGAEAERRGGHVPVLRLTWSDQTPPPDGCDTAVVLPLRDDAAVAAVRDQLAAAGPALLLMLPALGELVVDDGSRDLRVVRAGDLHVRTVDAEGPVPADVLADRPVEERTARSWWLRWATPVPAGVARVVHAPTPTDEPLDLPAVLLGSFPLDASRRHVAPGPLLDLLVDRAAHAYADLVRSTPDAGDADAVLALVPGPVAAGPLDARLRPAVLAALRDAPLLPGGLRPVDAVAVDGLTSAAYDVLGDAVPALLPPSWAVRRELDALAVRRLRLGDLVDDLAGLERAPSWWGAVYDATADMPTDQLGGLPVPLADGRLVRGPRGVVVGADGELAAALAAVGVRVVHPDASSPALLRLGALPAEPDVLLGQPAVRAAVEASLDADEPAALAEAVLTLVAAAPGDVPDWVGELALPDDEGGWGPAGELVLPGSPVARLLRPGELGRVDDAWVERWGVDVLRRVGCPWTLALVRDDEVVLDPDLSDHDLDDEDRWVEEVAGDTAGSDDLPATVPAFTAVRDLDLVADDAWPEALRDLASDPGLRAAVVEQVRVLDADGRPRTVEPYTAWWLRTHPVLGGQRPDRLRAPGSGELAGLLPEAPDLGLDEVFLRAIGVATQLADVAGSPMVVPLLRAGVDPAGVRPDDGGIARPVPAVLARVAADLPATYVEHDELRVGSVGCDWWVDDGTVHAATLDGLARGLAWASGRWHDRLLYAAVLAEPSRVDELVSELAFEDGQPGD